MKAISPIRPESAVVTHLKGTKLETSFAVFLAIYRMLFLVFLTPLFFQDTY